MDTAPTDPELSQWLRWASEGAIPLEVNAFALGRQFQAGARRRFSVADEVARWVREERF